MLHLAAANAKYELTESEIEFWKRQVADYPEEMIERFFSEHVAHNKWMPQFCDLHDWAELEVERRNQESERRQYEESSRRQYQSVMAWRNSATYESDMKAIREKLLRIVSNAKPLSKPLRRREIPLAFSPDKEKEIIARFIQEKSR